MALNFNGGGLFGNGEPATKKPEKTVAELEREVAVLAERNKALEEQQKLQRDSYLQLNQQHNQQIGLLREQLSHQINRHHPNTLPSASAPPPSDNWEDLVNTLSGGQPAPAQAGTAQPPIPRQVLKQAVRETILEEANAASAAERQERATLDQLTADFKIRYSELAANPRFTQEVDRVFVGLRKTGVGVEQAWQAALQEAAHIHKNYQQRQPDPAQAPANGGTAPIMPLGGAYLFPAGQGGAAPRGGPGSDTILDMRPPQERFKDASKELSETQLEWAKRAFGF